METLAAAVRQTDFAVTKRGYDPATVDAFLDELATAVAGLEEALRTETLRANSLQRRFAVAGDAEDSIEVAYMAAAEAKQKLLADAEERAAEIVRSAEIEAETIGEEPKRDADRVRRDAEDILLQAKARLEAAESEADRMQAHAEQLLAEAGGEADRTRAEAVAAAEDLAGVARTEAEAVIARAEDEAEEKRAAARRDAIGVIEMSQREADSLIAATREEHEEILRALTTLKEAVADMLRTGRRDSEAIRIVVDTESADLRLAGTTEEATG